MVHHRTLSGVPAEEEEPAVASAGVPDVYASSDPTEHATETCGQMYKPTSEASAIMEATAPQLLEGMAEQLGELALLVRRPTMKVIAQLKEAANTGKPARVVVTGEQGTGKSFGLLHAMDYARSAGWAVAYVPQPSLWCNTPQNIEHSTWKPGHRIDQHTTAGQWLEGFKEWNAGWLGEHTVSAPYVFGATKEQTNMDTTLLKLVERGVDDDRFACDIVGIMFKELGALSAERPLLLAVDQYNTLLHPEFPQFKDFEGVALTPERATLLRAFRKLIAPAADGEGAMQHGAMVLAEDPRFVSTDRISADPMLKGSVRVRYPVLDQTELHAFAQHYRAAGWMAANPTTATLETLSYLSNRNPKILSGLMQGM